MTTMLLVFMLAAYTPGVFVTQPPLEHTKPLNRIWGPRLPSYCMRRTVRLQFVAFARRFHDFSSWTSV